MHGMNWHNRVFFWIAALTAAWACPLHATAVRDVRVSAKADHTRVVFDLSDAPHYKLFQLHHPDRVVLDFADATLASGFQSPGSKGLMSDVRTGHHGKHGVRVVLDMRSGVHPKSFRLKPRGHEGHRLVVDLYPDSSAGRKMTRHSVAVVPGGDRKVVVAVDAGHGGRDDGATGPNGLMEKTVTLAVARKLARRIDAQPGMRAVLTRSDDEYVPLKKRFEIARKHKADLFVSIHANSCPDYCDARGASVWVLSTHGKQSEAGRWLARSENASSDLVGGVSLGDKSHTLAAVLLDLSQGASMQAAKNVGHDVLHALGKISSLYKRKVEHANFVVLRSPDVPSILVETAFISSHRDEHLLGSSAYRSKLASAILSGVKHYFRTTPPPGTWFAAQRDKRLGIQVAASRAASDHANSVASQADDANIRDVHRVSRGETLSGIAQQYGTTIHALKSANSLSSNTLHVGAVLAIPAS